MRNSRPLQQHKSWAERSPIAAGLITVLVMTLIEWQKSNATFSARESPGAWFNFGGELLVCNLILFAAAVVPWHLFFKKVRDPQPGREILCQVSPEVVSIATTCLDRYGHFNVGFYLRSSIEMLICAPIILMLLAPICLYVLTPALSFILYPITWTLRWLVTPRHWD